MKYAYYPGCATHASSTEYGMSTKAVCSAMGIELQEVKDWVCCGASAAHMTNHELTAALPAMNLAKASAMGAQEIMTPCPACYIRLAGGKQRMDEDEHLRDEVGKLLPQPYSSEVKVRHVLQAITPAMVREHVKVPLEGRRVAVYYGCVLMRPKHLAVDENIENPTVMDDMAAACGLEPVKWPYKVRCCGASLSVSKPEVAMRMTYDILDMAVRAGAEMVVVACPLCQANLDIWQTDIQKKYNRKFNIPVIYITQAIGLAMGLDRNSLGLDLHFVDPRDRLQPRKAQVA